MTCLENRNVLDGNRPQKDGISKQLHCAEAALRREEKDSRSNIFIQEGRVQAEQTIERTEQPVTETAIGQNRA